jgi:hypothetical protein
MYTFDKYMLINFKNFLKITAAVLMATEHCHTFHLATYPNITAFQIIMLLSVGAPLTPVGGSS